MVAESARICGSVGFMLGVTSYLGCAWCDLELHGYIGLRINIIWHIPGLSLALNKSIKFASANARRTCLPGMSIMNTHTEIHNMAQRALPANVCMCKYAIMFYKLIQNIICEDEFLYLNFQLLDNERVTKFKFVKQQSFDVGKNILLNRMYDTIDNKIDKKWLQLGLDSYKIECKDLFLKLMMLSLGGPTK